MKPARVLPLVFVLMLLMVAPVSAAPPVIEDGSFDDNYMPPYFQPCPGIEVWDHEVGTYRMMTYFDKDGNVERVKIQLHGTDNFYNPLNPDVVLSGDFSGSAEIDLETGEFINVSGLAVCRRERGLRQV